MLDRSPDLVAILKSARARNRNPIYPTFTGRSFVQGDHAAVEGKLAVGDSRSAYVLRRLDDGQWAPVSSYWHYSDAAAYVRGAGKMQDEVSRA